VNFPIKARTLQQKRRASAKEMHALLNSWLTAYSEITPQSPWDCAERNSFHLIFDLLVLRAALLIASTAAEYTLQYFLASSTSELWITPPNSTRTAG